MMHEPKKIGHEMLAVVPCSAVIYESAEVITLSIRLARDRTVDVGYFKSDGAVVVHMSDELGDEQILSTNESWAANSHVQGVGDPSSFRRWVDIVIQDHILRTPVSDVSDISSPTGM